MKTTPKALKDLYVALGGEAADVADLNTSVEVLNAISAKYEGVDDATLNPVAIENIVAVADSIGGVTPTGTKTITENGTHDVTEYAIAEVNVSGGGSSDFTTAEVTLICSGSDCTSNYEIVCIDQDKIVGFTIDETYGVMTSEDISASVSNGNPQTITLYILSGYTIVAYYQGGLDQDGYTIEGNAEVINIGSAEEPYYAVQISGGCTISTAGRRTE